MGGVGFAPTKAAGEAPAAMLGVPTAAGLIHAVSSLSLPVWHWTRLQPTVRTLLLTRLLVIQSVNPAKMFQNGLVVGTRRPSQKTEITSNPYQPMTAIELSNIPLRPAEAVFLPLI
jgi:hypothetical protein